MLLGFLLSSENLACLYVSFIHSWLDFKALCNKAKSRCSINVRAYTDARQATLKYAEPSKYYKVEKFL